MSKTRENTQKAADRRSIFEYVTEILGWLEIMVSPLLISIILASIIYFPNPTKGRLIFAILITFSGLIVGIIWATKVWKKYGTTRYMSSGMSSAELHPKDKENN